MLTRMERRHLIGMLAVGIAIITTVLYIHAENLFLLIAGCGLGAALMAVTLLGTMVSRRSVNRRLVGRFRQEILREINKQGGEKPGPPSGGR